MRHTTPHGFATREVFETILDWAVIPTFDLLIEKEGQGFIWVRRKISPYNRTWALPGLRIYTLQRIALQEVGLEINPGDCHILGQINGFFDTEHNRQDISTGYHIVIDPDVELVLNAEHFSGMRISYETPHRAGAMYRDYASIAMSSRSLLQNRVF
jgi:hypothetical protein